MRIAVIGAGLAGLSAADILARNGHIPHVFEARNRVGGRTWSTQLAPDCVIERGAEFIYSTDYEVRALAARFRLPIVSHGVRFARRTVNGSHVSAGELAHDFVALSESIEKLAQAGEPDPSFAQTAAHAFGVGYATHPTFLRIATSLAGDPEVASARSLLGKGTSSRFIADEGRFLDGNQQLSERLSASLPNPVQLETPIIRIEQTDTEVTVRTSDGTPQEFDACILAVPLPVLKGLQFGFDLPLDLITALSHLRMGVAAKISAPVSSDDRFDSALQQPESLWWSWQSLSRDGETRVPLITGFAGGPEAQKKLQIPNGPDAWLAALTKSTGATLSTSEAILTDWWADEWAQGAYSYRTVGWVPADLDALQRPIGRVVLAGEHTGLHGTMNGAVVSGQRAVDALLETLVG